MLPSPADDNTSSSNRRGRPPPSSLRALTRLELRRQRIEVCDSVLDDIIAEYTDDSPAPSRQLDDIVSEYSDAPPAPPRDHAPTPTTRRTGAASSIPNSQGIETSSAPVLPACDHERGSLTFLLPQPLNPRPRPRPASAPPPPPPSPEARNFSRPYYHSPETTGIPVPIAQTPSTQQQTALQVAMVELEIELEHLRLVIE